MLIDWLKGRKRRRKVPVKPIITNGKDKENDKEKENDQQRDDSQMKKKPINYVKQKRSKCNIFLEIVFLFIGSILLFFCFLDAPIQPVTFKLPPPPIFEGSLSPNTKLQSAKILLKGKVFGPESLAIKDGVIYTGTGDGQLIAINGTDVNNIASFHANQDSEKIPCGLADVEHICGRPLGLRFDKSGSSLYVAEAYSGLYKINLTSGTARHLSKHNDQQIGDRMQFVNDLDVTSDGVVYFTDSSSRWQRRDNVYLISEGSSNGRIFKYDPITDRTEVVLEDLAFPNGVQLSPDEDFLLFSEMTYARINLLFLKGTMKGQVVSFIENLPGLPDNIRASSSGGYWVGFAKVRKQPFSLYDFLSNRPFIKSYLSKIIPLELLPRYLPKYGLIVELDRLGNIKQSLHDPSGEVVPACSEILDTGDSLYLGSYDKNYIAKIDLK
ncbi:adipocyte plasma membrane-associated protein-like isoform X2 [Antedon mediterranea]|uniref:adipocyte plasma membrane-associated protein-like isoform X2 n=1 Tax=Antedon mediterranea TaxID=105859 RepID=UPI003AF8D05D